MDFQAFEVGFLVIWLSANAVSQFHTQTHLNILLLKIDNIDLLIMFTNILFTDPQILIATTVLKLEGQ